MARKKKSIFIVDDNEMSLEIMSDHLESQNRYEIRNFKTGEEALEQIYDEPDVVILDYVLNSNDPEAKDGLKILDAIKKEDKKIKVIMLSSQEKYGVATQSILKGAVYYVIKGENAFGEIDKILSEI